MASAGCGRFVPALLRAQSRMRSSSFSFLSSAARIFSLTACKVSSGTIFLRLLNRQGTLADGHKVLSLPEGMSKATAVFAFPDEAELVALMGLATVIELDEIYVAYP